MRCLSILSFIGFLALTPIAQTQGSQVIFVSEGSLRKLATKKVLPQYPQEARKRKAKGVAVTSVEVDESGNVMLAKILESPDPLINDEVLKAVNQWKFKPTTVGGLPARVRGKLTFYFVIDEKGAYVKDPS